MTVSVFALLPTREKAIHTHTHLVVKQSKVVLASAAPHPKLSLATDRNVTQMPSVTKLNEKLCGPIHADD